MGGWASRRACGMQAPQNVPDAAAGSRLLLPLCCCTMRRSVGQRLLLPSAGVAASVVLSALGALNSKRGRSKEGQLGGALDSEKPIPWQRRGNCCWAVLWGQR